MRCVKKAAAAAAAVRIAAALMLLFLFPYISSVIINRVFYASPYSSAATALFFVELFVSVWWTVRNSMRAKKQAFVTFPEVDTWPAAKLWVPIAAFTLLMFLREWEQILNFALVITSRNSSL